MWPPQLFWWHKLQDQTFLRAKLHCVSENKVTDGDLELKEESKIMLLVLYV